jgi:hypothetical protein
MSQLKDHRPKHVARVGAFNRCPSTGKLQYDSESDARKDAKAFRKTIGPRLEQYLCWAQPSCGKWHNGHGRKTRRV